LAKDFISKNFLDVSGWSTENVLAPSLLTVCGDVKMFGGYKVFGKGAVAKKVLTMPKH